MSPTSSISIPHLLPRRLLGPLGLSLLLVSMVIAPATTSAQQTPAQPPAGAAAAKGVFDTKTAPIPDALRDPRTDMRKFITDIAAFARKAKPSFVIVVEDGFRLIADEDELDQDRLIPNIQFMEQIDGVLSDGFRHPADGPREEEDQVVMETLGTIARNSRLPVLTIEHTQPELAGAAIARDVRDGYTPFVPADALESGIPKTPSRPIGENGNSIASLASTKNFIIIRDSSALGTQEEYARRIRATNYDLLIMDVYHARQPINKQTLEDLKYKLLGAKRMVLATVDVGRANPFHFYWKPEWKQSSPRFVDEKVKDASGRHYVRYWYPEWRNIIMGGAQSYIGGLILHGFDGIVIRGVDAYRFFDGSLQEEMEDKAAKMKKSAGKEMPTDKKETEKMEGAEKPPAK